MDYFNLMHTVRERGYSVIYISCTSTDCYSNYKVL